MTPLAVHIADGVLGGPWVVGGFAGAAVLSAPGLVRVREEEVPRLALMTAAFFVASSIHVPLPPTSVHLLLNGLVGVVLGRRAPLAILVGVGLQAVLLGHGGFTTVGVNTCVITLPALVTAAEAWARERGCTYAVLDYNARNVDAGRFYRDRLGYRSAGEIVLKKL